MADATRPDGSPYVIAGIGGSWFRYGGNGQWSWQRDFFDVGNATAAVHRDDQSRRPLRRDETSDGAGLLARDAPGPLPTGTGAGGTVGLTLINP